MNSGQTLLCLGSAHLYEIPKVEGLKHCVTTSMRFARYTIFLGSRRSLTRVARPYVTSL
jgi:hypothetical protein